MKSLTRLESGVVLADRILGLRAISIVFYGILPANLALLDIKGINVNPDVRQVPFLIGASLLPVIMTFALIRGRHQNWYLTTDWLNVRSLVATVLIPR